MNKFLVVVCGPTAVGKTEVAIQLAKHFNTEIISADARQFYIETNIGTAKPSAEQLATVKHHFINSLHIQEDYNAGKFETDCINLLNHLFLEKDVVVLCGGSGLYINAILKGMDELPEANDEIRRQLTDELELNGIKSLQQKLEQLDPEYFSTVDINNPHRLMRALEICFLSGKRYSELLNNKKTARNFIPIIIGLETDREILYKKINHRVDEMIQAEFLKECQNLFENRQLNSLNTVGYSELFAFIEGKTSLETAIELIKQHTRNYAKRQLTWFRKNKNIHWFEPNKIGSIVELVSEQTKQNGQ